MASFPYQFHFFVEGIRVPCEKMTIVQRPDAPARATFYLPPSDLAFHAPERSLVQVFFQDNSEGGGGLWHRLYEGEIVSKGIDYYGGKEVAVYSCLDDIVYWTQTHRKFYENNVEISGPNPEVRSAFYGQSVDGSTPALVEFIDVANLLWPIGTGSSVVARLHGIFDQMADINNYYRRSDRRRKLRRRLAITETPTSSEILLQQEVAIGKQLLDRGIHTTVWDVIKVLVRRLFFQMVSNPAPPYRRVDPRGAAKPLAFDNDEQLRDGLGWVGQHLMMPELTFAPPPRCNILLPPQVQTFKFAEDYLAAPTRTVARIREMYGLATLHYAPTGLQGRLGSSEEDRNFLTEEEEVRGFIPSEIQIDPSEILAAAGIDDPQVVSRRELEALATNYSHWRSVYSARRASGSGPFNPWLVSGFPGAVVNRRYGIIQGDLDEVVHSIEMAGQSFTTFVLHRCRYTTTPKGAEFVPEYRRLREVTPPDYIYPSEDKPAWFDGQWAPDKIGENLYQLMLGYSAPPYGSILNPLEEEDRVESPEEALTRIYDTFFSQSEAGQRAMVETFPRRPVVTMAESMFFLGAEPANAEQRKILADIDPFNDDDDQQWPRARAMTSLAWQNAGGGDQPDDATHPHGPFRKWRQAWARAYRQEMAKSKGAVR